MYFPIEEQKSTQVSEGLTRTFLAEGGKLMSVRARFEKGYQLEPHSHPEEQVSFIIKGKLRCSIAGEVKVLEEGDSLYVPSDVQHSMLALEEAVIIDVFTPQRQDLLT